MNEPDTLGASLARTGISRRSFLKFCTAMASLMALPPVPLMRWPTHSTGRNVNRSSGYRFRNVPAAWNRSPAPSIRRWNS